MRLLMGGSPCTYWSIAQTKNRETEASGMGWELFRNYVMARDKFQPDYFLYENNKSMSPAIRTQITAMLGVEPVLINSALVSAQNRKRLYWCGKREADGSYSKVEIEQPEDRGILLRDVLESGTAWREKGYTIDANYYRGGNLSGFQRQSGNRLMVAEPVKVLTEREMEYMIRETKDGRNHFDYGYVQDGTQDKGKCVTANISKGVPYNVLCEPVDCAAMRQVGRRINEEGHRDDYNENIELRQRFEVNEDPQKTNCLTTVTKDNMIAEPVRIGTVENDANTRQYAAPIMCVPEATKKGYAEIAPGECVDLAQEHSKTRRGRRMAEKSNCLTTTCNFYEYCGTLDCPVYQVRDGLITIKGKQYPIKLRDGCYIIRKLTVTECKRLQTVPENFVFPVSDSQAYKMLGNGWTVEVIMHLLKHFDGITTEPVDVLSMYDGMACGHIALGNLGVKINSYFATEIDKYAVQTATHNFPDIIELGDAFQVRNEDWRIPEWLM